MRLARVTIENTKDEFEKARRFSGSAGLTESFTDREMLQQYGIISRPLPGAEGLVVAFKDGVFMIASGDRRYRIALQDGEVALYTDEGDKIHLMRNSEILVKSGGKVIINAPVIELKGGMVKLADGRQVKLMTGQRVVVRLSLPAKPLGAQWWRALLQLVQRRFHG